MSERAAFHISEAASRIVMSFNALDAGGRDRSEGDAPRDVTRPERVHAISRYAHDHDDEHDQEEGEVRTQLWRSCHG